MARLWASSDSMSLVRQAMIIAISRVGMIMAMPNGFHIMHQLTSFKSQNMICIFSILRKRAGITYIDSCDSFIVSIKCGPIYCLGALLHTSIFNCCFYRFLLTISG